MSKPESSRVTWAKKLRVITENRVRRAERWRLALWAAGVAGTGAMVAMIDEAIKWMKGN